MAIWQGFVKQNTARACGLGMPLWLRDSSGPRASQSLAPDLTWPVTNVAKVVGVPVRQKIFVVVV